MLKNLNTKLKNKIFGVFVEMLKLEIVFLNQCHTLRKMCPDSEFFWPVFLHIRNRYGNLLSISPYSKTPNTDTSRSYKSYQHGIALC